MDMPALFEFPGHIFLAITEAALLDYAGCGLVDTFNSSAYWAILKIHTCIVEQCSFLLWQENMTWKFK